MSKGDELYEELAHYAIEQFMTHKRYEELVEKDMLDPDYGHCRAFILMIMKNAWYGGKSEFTRVHKNHRADIGKRKRVLDDRKFNSLLEDLREDDYDFNRDRIIEAVMGILEEMNIDNKKLWYNAKLFEMYLETPNYSELSRKTDIPRTTISVAVKEAIEYIKQELKKRNIDTEL